MSLFKPFYPRNHETALRHIHNFRNNIVFYALFSIVFGIIFMPYTQDGIFHSIIDQENNITWVILIVTGLFQLLFAFLVGVKKYRIPAIIYLLLCFIDVIGGITAFKIINVIVSIYILQQSFNALMAINFLKQERYI